MNVGRLRYDYQQLTKRASRRDCSRSSKNPVSSPLKLKFLRLGTLKDRRIYVSDALHPFKARLPRLLRLYVAGGSCAARSNNDIILSSIKDEHSESIDSVRAK